MERSEVASLLAPEGLATPVSGTFRLADGGLHVSVLTPMPGTRPEMIAWWFGSYLETTEHYRRWHPRDHLWMAWEDKRPGTHLGASHLVHETIGGRLQKLRIHFLPPESLFGDALARHPEAVAICGRVGLLERPIDVGHLAHLALPRPWGCDLHSRFWLGDVASRDGPGLMDRLASRPALRRLATPHARGRALLVHCHEEMTTLAGFLPELYAAEVGAKPFGRST